MNNRPSVTQNLNFGSNNNYWHFDYQSALEKGTLENNREEIKKILNPPGHDRSKIYEKDLTHGKPYFACE